jgi:hypothetical protein
MSWRSIVARRIDDEGQRPALLTAVALEQTGNARDLLGREVALGRGARDIDHLGEGMDAGIGQLPGQPPDLLGCDPATRDDGHGAMQP